LSALITTSPTLLAMKFSLVVLGAEDLMIPVWF
jgi:hypothetical protein